MACFLFIIPRIILLVITLLGSVKVWDPRQKDVPVANMETTDGETKRDCWCVAFGMYLTVLECVSNFIEKYCFHVRNVCINVINFM